MPKIPSTSYGLNLPPFELSDYSHLFVDFLRHSLFLLLRSYEFFIALIYLNGLCPFLFIFYFFCL